MISKVPAYPLTTALHATHHIMESSYGMQPVVKVTVTIGIQLKQSDMLFSAAELFAMVLLTTLTVHRMDREAVLRSLWKGPVDYEPYQFFSVHLTVFEKSISLSL